MRLPSSPKFAGLLAIGVSLMSPPAHAQSPAQDGFLDVLYFGDSASESTHALAGSNSEIVTGLLGQKARRLLPLNPVSWKGGTLDFTLKIDPAKPNYFTIKLSGDDVSENRLLLFIEGKQVGYKHLGDVDQLDFGTVEPAYNGRFYYNTTPLPLNLTQGKTELKCEIRSIGRIWSYGTNFAQYQKNLETPTRGIYGVYTHTDGSFVPPVTEKQGAVPAPIPVRTSPGPEVLDRLKARVNSEILARLNDTKPLSQMQMQLLAKAYDVSWTAAYQKPETITRISTSLDAMFAAYRKNPKLAQADPVTWNPDWYGLGVTGHVLMLLADELKPGLDVQISDGAAGQTTRRAAYSEMLLACRDWHRQHRRLYTNQTMINDLYGIYFANRGLEVVDPDKALSEPAVRRYLYESLALEPWRDSDPGGEGGPAETGGRNWGVGANYYQFTAKGLSKELGYVGTYGEVLDWVNDIYDATRPSRNQPGDPEIKAQLVKIAEARAAMRHPALDAERNRAMRLEQIIGWRDAHYPGVIAYGQRQARDASPLQTAFNTQDAHQIGYAQQMLADNQFFATVATQLEEGGLRVTIGLLETPDQYEWLKQQAASPFKLPMTWDQPDHVFTDEEDGVVAVKHKNELLYVSLYWRARHGINNLARVHFTTPELDRIAVVRQKTQFEPSGMFYTRPDWTNLGFANGGLTYPEELHSAHMGEQLPIAKIPPGVTFKPGDESVYAGKGTFYTLRYGHYLIGLNTTPDKSFDLKATADATDLVTGKAFKAGQVLKVGPRTTAILFDAG